MARLTGNTVLRHPESGLLVHLSEGDEIPAWADELIGDHLRAVDVPVSAPADNEDGQGADSGVAGEQPPRTGIGSGRDAWVGYASSIGIPVDDSMGRGDIIAAVDALAAS